MAHPDPSLAQLGRNMAHRVPRGPLSWPGRILRALGSGIATAISAPSAIPGAVRGALPKEPKRRELTAVLALVLAACAISAGIPVMAATSHSSDPTATPSSLSSAIAVVEEESATPTATPSPTPTATPSPTPTATPTAKPTPAPTKKHRVYPFVALGDSLTSGYNTPGPAWPTILDTKDPYLVLSNNAGVPGNTTAQMKARLNSDVFDYKPNYVLILGGTNDIGDGISQSTTIANLRYIITQAKSHGAVPIIINVPPNSTRSSAIDNMNAAIVSLANAYRVVVVDIHTPLSASNGTIQARYTSDGLHFSSLGSQVVANTIYNRVRRLGI